jgi:hypothetical protein
MEILNFEEAMPGAYELAFFDVDFGSKWGIILGRFKLCRSKNGHYYFQSSSYKKGEKDGKPNWKPYIESYGEKGKEFTASVLELLKPFINKIGSPQDASYF